MSGVPRSVLVVGPSWVGDMVMAQSLFINLRRHNPDIEIDVLAPAWSLPVLNRMPEIRKSIAVPAGHGELKLLARWQTAKQLRASAYDQAIVLPRSFKSALIPAMAGIPKRTGYTGETRFGLINDRRHLNTSLLDQTVKKFVALGMGQDTVIGRFDCPQPKLMVDGDNQSRLFDGLGLDISRPAISLMPGAEYGPAKQWPVEHYAALVQEIEKQGMQAWIFGSTKDQPVAAKIIELAQNRGINLCGKTALADAIDLIAYTQAAVSNDSGLMHVAAAVGRPVVAIYGSSSPSYTPPLTDNAEIMYLNIECSPCFARTCRYKHYRCLTDITVNDVMDRLMARCVAGGMAV